MMKKSFIFIICILAFNIQIFAQNVSYNFHPESKITVTGTSSIHDWTLNVNKYSGQVQLKKALAQKSMKKGDAFENIEIIMDVKSLESGRGSSMDNRTYEALKAEKFPEITFKSKNSEITEIKNDQSGTFVMMLMGDLSIAGVTKPIELIVEGQKLKDGRFVFTGSHTLKMTEYEIKPPSAMFGQIVAGDEVTIKLDQLTLTPKK